jgi:anthranilate phosphoribosyltransferase
VLNTAAALLIAGHAASIPEGITQAAGAIDSGRARQALDRLITISTAGTATTA